MRKTYQLNIEGKNRDRLLDAAKHDIRKYAKRERAKPLPAGVDFWDFECSLGVSDITAVAMHFAALTGAIDELLSDGGDHFFVSVVAKPGYRVAKPVQPVAGQHDD
jgi:hypothetical protein